MLSRRELILMLVVASVMLCIAGWIWRQPILAGSTEYVSFYCGGKNVGTGSLYDNAAFFNCQLEALRIGWMPHLLFVRPAWYALALKPLAIFPYFASYWLWTVLNAGALLWLLYILGREDRSLLLFAALFPPTFMSVFLGEDVAILTAIFTLFILASRRRKDSLAGSVLALCSIKFHLFAMFPIAAICLRRWRLLLAAAAVILALLGLSGIVEGFSWPVQYARVLTAPDPHPHPEVMPNLRTLLAVFGLNQASLLVTASAILAAALTWSCIRHTTAERVWLTSMLGGILIVPHIYIYDLLLLLPCYYLTKADPGLRFTRILVGACLFPIAPVLLVKGPPWNALMPGLLLAAVVSSMCPGSVVAEE